MATKTDQTTLVADPCAELVARCFASRTTAHFAHLSTTSYAAHKTLERYYQKIGEKADKFAEVYMGNDGRITDWPSVPVTHAGKDIRRHLTELSAWVTVNRTLCANGATELLNIIDDILALISRTNYLLGLA